MYSSCQNVTSGYFTIYNLETIICAPYDFINTIRQKSSHNYLILGQMLTRFIEVSMVLQTLAFRRCDHVIPEYALIAV